MTDITEKGITPEQGRRITLEALSWRGTKYDGKVGIKSAKGQTCDCSGSTWSIYCSAGFPYEHMTTKNFATNSSKLFRQLKAHEACQDGDILLWVGEHMAIYSTFRSTLEAPYRTTDRVNIKTSRHWTQLNDIWTAHHDGGPPFGEGNSEQFSKTSSPKVFRYIGTFRAPAG